MLDKVGSILKKFLSSGVKKHRYLFLPELGTELLKIEDGLLMRDFTEVIVELNRLIDQVQGSVDKDGNRISAELLELSKKDLHQLRFWLGRLRETCQLQKGLRGYGATQNAINMLNSLKRKRNVLHVLLIVKALLETGMVLRAGYVTEVSPSLWKSSDGRWFIQKVVSGRNRALYDIYLSVGDERIFTCRCNRKNDAENILAGTRTL